MHSARKRGLGSLHFARSRGLIPTRSVLAQPLLCSAPNMKNIQSGSYHMSVRSRWLAIGIWLLFSTRALAQSATPPAPPSTQEPFAWGDFTWLNGGSRQTTRLLDNQYFTPQIDIDSNYTYSLNAPIDNTIVGSTATARHNELSLAFAGVGGDLHIRNVRARIFTQFGTRSSAVPRNDLLPMPPLTLREEEVLKLMAGGLRNKEIAARLSITERTATFHVGNVLSKLGADGRVEAIHFARRRGLI